MSDIKLKDVIAVKEFIFKEGTVRMIIECNSLDGRHGYMEITDINKDETLKTTIKDSLNKRIEDKKYNESLKQEKASAGIKIEDGSIKI